MRRRLESWVMLLVYVVGLLGFGMGDVHADSNDRRTALLNLGAGKSLKDVDFAKNIDSASLRVLSLYLSNYYVPFTTVLDGEYLSDKDSGNELHVRGMEKALVENVGVDSESAAFLVKYILQQSLDTCAPLYVRKKDFEGAWEIFSSNGGVDSSIGFFAPELTGGVLEKSATVVKDRSKFVESMGGYRSYAGDEYLQLSYGVFLQFLQLGMHGFHEIAMKSTPQGVTPGVPSAPYAPGYVDPTQGSSQGNTQGSVVLSDELLLSAGLGVKESTVGRLPVKGIPLKDKENVVNFYHLDGGSANVVFSNSRESISSFLLGMEGVKTKYGYGTSAITLSLEEIEKTLGGKLGDGKGVFSLFSKLYINWEGSLVYDTGVNRVVVLPGALNPYMLRSIDKGIGVSLQNLVGVDNVMRLGFAGTNGANWGMPYLFKGVDKNESMAVASEWTLGLDMDMTAVDDKGFGLNPFAQTVSDRNKSFLEYMESVGVEHTLSGGSDDPLPFPTVGLEPLDGYEDVGVFSWGGKGYRYVSDGLLSVLTTAGQGSAEKYSTLGGYDQYGYVRYNRDLVWYDSLEGINSKTQLSSLFRVISLDEDGFLDRLRGDGSLVSGTFADITRGANRRPREYTMASKKLFQNVFWTYCFAYFNRNATSYSRDTNIVNLKMNVDIFPRERRAVDWSKFYAGEMQARVLSFVYLLLHPKEGAKYVAELVSTKVGGVFLDWHDKMVGGTDSNSALGTTRHLGSHGYTTIPEVGDIGYASRLLDFYNSILVYVVLFMSFVFMCYVLVGEITIGRGVVGLILFTFVVFLPTYVVGLTIGEANKLSTRIFSGKFDYWAIVQMQEYLIRQDAAVGKKAMGELADYAAFVIDTQGSGSDAAGKYTGVKLKWMAPKRFNTMGRVRGILDSTVDVGGANFLSSLLINSVSRATSGESYDVSNDALYLYRDYVDIYRHAGAGYNILSTYNFGGALRDYNSMSLVLSREYPLIMYNSDVSQGSTYHLMFHRLRGLVKTPLDFGDGFSLSDYLGANIYNDGGVVSGSAVLSETSSADAVRRGFLFDTVGYSGNVGSPIKYFASAKDGDGGNTLALSYLAGYNHTIKTLLDRWVMLREVKDGSARVQLNLPMDGGYYYNFGLSSVKGNQNYVKAYSYGFQDIIGLETEASPVSVEAVRDAYAGLSDYIYGLYTESPFYYLNYVVRDHLNAAKDVYRGSGIDYAYLKDVQSHSGLAAGDTKVAITNNLAKLFLYDGQGYFYNKSLESGDGFGELRDFMNMHDFFYYVMPLMRVGVEHARNFDEMFGLQVDGDVSLTFDEVGGFTYSGVEYSSLDSFRQSNVFKAMSDEARYKFWHAYNVRSVLEGYSAWLDTMMDAGYARPEKITIGRESYVVDNPLVPYDYYEVDSNGELVSGRYMVFSRSEMKYYGLTWGDLTRVEQNIITMQDNVYKGALKLMNYSTLSDEVLIQAYSMLQLFEFNKVFSEPSILGRGHILYPQGYELKAFSYDAYLRMILSAAEGESLMHSGSDGKNVSIYRRIQDNASMFFGVFLLVNDFLAVRLIPLAQRLNLGLFFVVSILVLLAGVLKVEQRAHVVFWKGVFLPLISFGLVSVGLSYVASLFMAGGPVGITRGNEALLGGLGAEAVLLVQIGLNALVFVLYGLILKKTFTSAKRYAFAVGNSVSSVVPGAFGGFVKGAMLWGAYGRLMGRGGSIPRYGSGSGSAGKSSAEMRARGNKSMLSGVSSGVMNVLSKANAGVHNLAGKFSGGKESGNKYDKVLSRSAGFKREYARDVRVNLRDARHRLDMMKSERKVDWGRARAMFASGHVIRGMRATGSALKSTGREAMSRASVMRASASVGMSDLVKKVKASRVGKSADAIMSEVSAARRKFAGYGDKLRREYAKWQGTGESLDRRLERRGKAEREAMSRDYKARNLESMKDAYRESLRRSAERSEVERERMLREARDAWNGKMTDGSAVSKSVARHLRKRSKGVSKG